MGAARTAVAGPLTAPAGRNWARVVVMVFSTLSIASSFVAWWAQGQEITLQSTFLSLSLDILILLAVSSQSAAAYASPTLGPGSGVNVLQDLTTSGRVELTFVILEDNLPVEAHIVWIGNGLPVDTDIAGCRSGEPRHNLQQGSFARSRFADDAKAFAPVDV